mmetsp:Transcript_28176/g.43169  ORF Transcript_28176/g.43169 Transcript_28176/m.43169 type:complete len:256 (-) Transcript_28176:3150-3917(-)
MIHVSVSIIFTRCLSSISLYSLVSSFLNNSLCCAIKASLLPVRLFLSFSYEFILRCASLNLARASSPPSLPFFSSNIWISSSKSSTRSVISRTAMFPSTSLFAASLSATLDFSISFSGSLLLSSVSNSVISSAIVSTSESNFSNRRGLLLDVHWSISVDTTLTFSASLLKLLSNDARRFSSSLATFLYLFFSVSFCFTFCLLGVIWSVSLSTRSFLFAMISFSSLVLVVNLASFACSSSLSLANLSAFEALALSF